jgi:hypothetical protein
MATWRSCPDDWKERAMSQCSLDGCDRPAWAKGMCAAHYMRSRIGSPPMDAPIRHRASRRKTCKVTGCDKPHHARGYCLHHYNKRRKNGIQ